MLFTRTTELVKGLIRNEIKNVKVAVDGTMGNGNDTLFMAQLVGDEGKVYAFDIQQAAIEATSKNLEEAGIPNVTLIHDSHANMKKYVDEADLIMFNLGYLPKGDHRVITLPASTCEAIENGLAILSPGGIMSVLSYYGHDGGEEEKVAVGSLLESLDEYRFDVMEINPINKKNAPPIIYIVRKKHKG